jgi:hypothetical protein
MEGHATAVQQFIAGSADLNAQDKVGAAVLSVLVVWI